MFKDRISVSNVNSVNGTDGSEGVVLTIKPVTLEDEVEFICLVRTFTGEAKEGRTQLRVFRKINFTHLSGWWHQNSVLLLYLGTIQLNLTLTLAKIFESDLSYRLLYILLNILSYKFSHNIK